MKHKLYETIGEEVYSEKLANGLSVYVIPKRGFNKCYAFFATDYGGADRRFKLSGQWIDTPEGVAHFLEHKMFDTPDGNALTMLSANGASPNAFTSSEITAYHFESTDKFFENLEILLKFVSIPYFTPESVQKEQGIIGQEIRMTEDEPNFAVYYNLMKLLFQYNPVRDSVAGTVESIAEITADTLYSCHKVFYNPSNMVLCVAGDVDPKQVIATANRLLPTEPGENPERDYGAEENILPSAHCTETTMAVSKPLFLAGASVPSVKSGTDLLRQELTGELALEILAGQSSPLYAQLYRDGLITNDFGAAFETVAGVAYVMLGGESSDPAAVTAAIQKEAARIATTGCDSDLFRRLKKSLTGAKIRSLNSFDSICYTYARGYFRNYDVFDSVQILNTITDQDIRAFIANHITAEKMAVSIVRPSA
jgi:predicted Zn-dependent peptidase